MCRHCRYGRTEQRRKNWKCLTKGSLSVEDSRVILSVWDLGRLPPSVLFWKHCLLGCLSGTLRRRRGDRSTEASEQQTTLGPSGPGSVHALKLSSKKVQGFTFFHEECELVTFALVVKVWELWLHSSLPTHFFSWTVPASQKKHPIIRNVKTVYSCGAVPVCGGNGNNSGVISFLAKEKNETKQKNLFFISPSCSP